MIHFITEPFADKWKAFGWDVRIENGHDHIALSKAFAKSRSPMCIVAETTKGKGVDFMENSVLWHYKSPGVEDVISAFSQLKENH